MSATTRWRVEARVTPATAANWHKRAWVTARANAGFPSFRFHDLRHSAVPLWVAMGANLLQLSRWLGHSTVQITADVYGDLFPETNDVVIGRLDRALRAALPHPDQPDENSQPAPPTRDGRSRHEGGTPLTRELQ